MISRGVKMPSDGDFAPYRGGTTTPEGGIIFSEVGMMHSTGGVLSSGRHVTFSRRRYAFFGCAITVLRGLACVFGPCKSKITSVLWHQAAHLKLTEG